MEKLLSKRLTFHGCLGKLALQVIDHKMESGVVSLGCHVIR